MLFGPLFTSNTLKFSPDTSSNTLGKVLSKMLKLSFPVSISKSTLIFLQDPMLASLHPGIESSKPCICSIVNGKVIDPSTDVGAAVVVVVVVVVVVELGPDSMEKIC